MPQVSVYERCIRQLSGRHMWMAFIDTDEYLMPMGSANTMMDVLRAYEDFGSLALNWVVRFLP